MNVTMQCKNRLRKWSRGGGILKFSSLLYTKLRGLGKKYFVWLLTKVGAMHTPSFVKIPDSGLKIPKNLVELIWNDP